MILERKRERNKHINKLVEYLIKMFRDLKEYQEIQKLYTDKVSKPEDLEENQANRMKMKATRDANRPKTREEVGLPPKKKPSPFERKFGKERNEKRMISQGVKKPMPTTAEIRAKNPKVVPGTRVNEIGAQGGGKPSEGDFKKDFPDKKPEISKFTKQGKERTPAQMAAAKRIGSGTAKNPDTTIAQVKQSNQDAMRARAKEKFAAFKEKRAEKKAAKMNEDITPYDIVLEYLLSSEQAATIEEANYVMTEMDAETIQGIVEMQGQINRADIIGGTPAAKNAAAGKGKYTPGKGVTKDFKLDPGFQLPKV